MNKESKSASLYIDGEQQPLSSNLGNIRSPEVDATRKHKFTIGSPTLEGEVGSRKGNFELNELAFWDAVLTDEDMERIYSSY